MTCIMQSKLSLLSCARKALLEVIELSNKVTQKRHLPTPTTSPSHSSFQNYDDQSEIVCHGLGSYG